ncbi:MAG: glutathione S-transferase family protein [Gaiellales bacterium]
MITLYWSPGTAAMAPQACLEEAGAEYELVRVRRDGYTVTEPEGYLELQPEGRIPAFRDGDLVLHESAAICMHVADRYPDAGLLPRLGTDERADAYRWLTYLTNTLQPTYQLWYQTDRFIDGEEARAAVKQSLEPRLNGIYDWIDGQLDGRSYLVGDEFSAADLYCFMLTRWGRNLPRKAWLLPSLGAHYRRLAERPSVAAMLEKQGIEAFPSA